MSKSKYTTGRGGVLAMIKSWLNPTTKTQSVKLPSNASLKGANIPKPNSSGQPNRGVVSNAPRSTQLYTTKPNTAFTTAMPNQTIRIPGPNITNSNSSSSYNFTPNFNTNNNNSWYPSPDFNTNYASMLKSIQGNNTFKTPLINKLAGAAGKYLDRGYINYVPFIGTAAQLIGDRNIGESLQSFGGNKLGQGFSYVPKIMSALTPDADASEKANQNLQSSNIYGQNQTKKPNRSTVADNERARLENERIQNDIDSYNSSIDKYNSQGSSDNGSNLTDDQLWVLNQQGNDLNNSTFQDQVDFENRQAEIRRKQAEQTFNFLKGNYESQIPFLENQVNQQIGDQNANLDRLVKQGEAQKVEDTNTYQDMIKKLTQNANAAKVQLGNVFSGYGTADSSAFQKQYGDLDRTLLEGTNTTERDLAKRLGTISDAVENSKRETESLIASIKTEGAAKKQAILNQINLSAEQRAQAIDQVNMDLDEAITEAKNFYNQKKYELMNNSRDLIQNRMLLNDQTEAQKSIDNNYFANQLKLNNIVGSSIDPTAEATLKDYVRRRGKTSSTELAELIKSLGIDENTAINYINGLS